VRIQGEIRALTAQARFSGIIIFVLPIALATLLAFISPDYFGPMLHKPGGLIMLGVGVVSMCFGYGMIQKIVKIEV
jgi:tight adherence protein B